MYLYPENIAIVFAAIIAGLVLTYLKLAIPAYLEKNKKRAIAVLTFFGKPRVSVRTARDRMFLLYVSSFTFFFGFFSYALWYLLSETFIRGGDIAYSGAAMGYVLGMCSTVLISEIFLLDPAPMKDVDRDHAIAIDEDKIVPYLSMGFRILGVFVVMAFIFFFADFLLRW